jgi:hypothetical protein
LVEVQDFRNLPSVFGGIYGICLKSSKEKPKDVKMVPVGSGNTIECSSFKPLALTPSLHPKT